MTMRKFISGRYAGTNIEIMPSKAATKLPDGTPIVAYDYDEAELVPAQVAHRLGKLNVHDRQVFCDLDKQGHLVVFEGPTIAQQWKAEYKAKREQRGWLGRYYNTGPVLDLADER